MVGEITPEIILKQIDEIDERIREAEKNKAFLYSKLKEIKRKLEDSHQHLIGKEAMCITEDNPNPLKCVCSSVIACDDYKTVRPLFARFYKKRTDIMSYEWI